MNRHSYWEPQWHTTNRLRYSLFLAILPAIAACVVPPPRTYGSYSSAPTFASSFTHGFDVVVQDFETKPIPGATVTFDITANTDTALPQQVCVTNDSGRCSASVEVPRNPTLTYVASYSSTAKVSTKLEGYYGAITSIYNRTGSSAGGTPPRTHILTILRPVDYLSDAFVASTQDGPLRAQALRFISQIRLQSLLVDTDLDPKSVGTLDYKGKKYLHLVFASENTYNSLKVTRYQIGQRLFDESVRKLLNPLNTNIGNPKAFYGYDIVMKSSTKDFSQKYATPTPLEYRFLMPQDAVRRYKDQDLSGQQLIDQSVVLLNEERFDLKLQ